MLTPALGADYAEMLYPIKNAESYNAGKLKDFNQVGVHALDDRTLQIVLEHRSTHRRARVQHLAKRAEHAELSGRMFNV